MKTILFFFALMQVYFFLATFKLYQKAEKKSWQALVPFYNATVLMDIISRPKWWSVLFYIPVVNLLFVPVVWLDIVKCFGLNKKEDGIKTLASLGLYIAYLNYNSKNLVYTKGSNLNNRSALEQWLGSLIYAIIAATLVHTYVFQPSLIPSSSLEKSLLVGDFLVVSKFHYGARMPMTPVSFPMVHDTLPIVKVKSYLFSDDKTQKKTSWLNKFQLPYFRFPGFQQIKRNEIVVFNQPADTLLDMNDFHPQRNYYKPIDKKTNLVKRCVAISGDTLQIKQGYVYVNGKRVHYSKRAKPQYNFMVNTDGKRLSQEVLRNRFGARDGLCYPNGDFGLTQSGGYVLTLTDKEASKVSKYSQVKSVTKLLQPKGKVGDVFPYVKKLGWNIDNYGPIYIPEKGKTIALTKDNLPFYKRIIEEYEDNDVKVIGNEIWVNDVKVNQYTFQQNYYWMMGDNRQNSIDSRFWGCVPMDHVVGKPVFIWFSWEQHAKGILNKIRWKRLFTTVKGEDTPISYFPYFVVLLMLYYGGKEIKKRGWFGKK